MKRSNRLKQVLILVFLIIAGVIFLAPVYFIVMNSFKPYAEIMTSFISLPKTISFHNYIAAWDRIDYPRIFGNTVFLSVGAMIVTILFSSMAGYKLQRTKTKLSKGVFYYFLFGMIIPFPVVMVPMAQMMLSQMKIGNNLPIIVFVYAALFMPHTIFIFYGYCKTLPKELDEAAMIDGCGPIRMYTRIIFPLSGTILVSIAVLSFLWTWNDFLVALITIDKAEMATITRRMNNFIGMFNASEWDFFTAAVTMSMLPVIVLYACLQKYVQSGILAGAIKG